MLLILFFIMLLFTSLGHLLMPRVVAWFVCQCVGTRAVSEWLCQVTRQCPEQDRVSVQGGLTPSDRPF